LWIKLINIENLEGLFRILEPGYFFKTVRFVIQPGFLIAYLWRMDIRIQNTLDYIENNLGSNLSLNDLARTTLMSPSHFHKVFKQETGYTPFNFIKKIKMSKAYAMLISGNPKIYELTDQLGYQDYETFSRAFKKHYALAPDDLKAIAQKIRSEVGIDDNGIIIKTIEVESISEISDNIEKTGMKLKTILLDKGYSEEDITKAKIMMIMPKPLDQTADQIVIKNKFVISENNTIWQSILNQKGDVAK
jgi:AraC-like DNA-binding protein